MTTTAEKKYLQAVADAGCSLCEFLGYGRTPCEVHHQRTGTGMGRRADHYHSTGLCVRHHKGEDGIHHLGRKAWERKFSITESELVARTRAKLAHLLPN